jgi:hypothetical protein
MSEGEWCNRHQRDGLKVSCKILKCASMKQAKNRDASRCSSPFAMPPGHVFVVRFFIYDSDGAVSPNVPTFSGRSIETPTLAATGFEVAECVPVARRLVSVSS